MTNNNDASQPQGRPLSSADYYRNVPWERYLPTDEFQAQADAVREEHARHLTYSKEERVDRIFELAREIAAREGGGNPLRIVQRWREIALDETYQQGERRLSSANKDRAERVLLAVAEREHGAALQPPAPTPALPDPALRQARWAQWVAAHPNVTDINGVPKHHDPASPPPSWFE
jgi:hypothetical protein